MAEEKAIYEMVNNEQLQFNLKGMNKKQKKVFMNFKVSIVKESIEIDNHLVKINDNLVTTLNTQNKLDIKSLNSNQKNLLDSCISELEDARDPRSTSNKRGVSKVIKKSFDKNCNEIVSNHLRELINLLNERQIHEFKTFCHENNLAVTKSRLDNCEKKMEGKNLKLNDVPQYVTAFNLTTNQAILTPVIFLPSIPINQEFLVLNSFCAISKNNSEK